MQILYKCIRKKRFKDKKMYDEKIGNRLTESELDKKFFNIFTWGTISMENLRVSDE